MCSIPTLIDREKSKPDRWSKQTLSIGFIVFPFIFTYGIYLIKVAWVSSSMFLMFPTSSSYPYTTYPLLCFLKYY